MIKNMAFGVHLAVGCAISDLHLGELLVTVFNPAGHEQARLQ